MSQDPNMLIRSLRARMTFTARALVVLLKAIQASCAAGACTPFPAKTAAPSLGRLVRTALGVSRQGDGAFARYRDLLLKRDMLRAPDWRARVLRELGGMRRLARWDVAMRAGIKQARRNRHSQQTPPPSPAERQVREAAQENRRAIAAIRAANNPHYVYARVKGDRMGQFRLPPIARGPRETWGLRGQDIHRRLAGRRAMGEPGRKPSGKQYLKERLVCVSPQDFRAAIFPGRPAVLGGGFAAPPDMRMTAAGPAYAPALHPNLRGPPR